MTRLKNRANIFRRKNYSSQIDISNPRTSLVADHMISSFNNQNTHLKRSNSMICSQQQFPLVSSSSSTTTKQRNSVCLPPTNDNEHYRLFKSSSTRFWKKKMSHIVEQDITPSDDDGDNNQSIETKISISTMTGKSLNNLDECLSSSSSFEDKCIQTAFEHHHSSTSLSSNSISIQTDSLENKPQFNQCQLKSHDKWSLPMQTCIYWVNYLGKVNKHRTTTTKKGK